MNAGGEHAASKAEDGAPRAVFRTFLLSDIRGYSSFAAARGDEATAALAARFAEIATRVVGEFGGELVGLRGDEVLAAFESPRQAIRCAISFQQALYHSTEVDRSLPMPAGAGIDVGEAITAVDGYRANAINVAARLCSTAKAGEILATREVTHLAQAIDGVRYQARPPAQMKGIADPVQYARVVAVEHDTARAYLDLGVSHAEKPPTHRRAVGTHRLLAAANALVILAALVLIATGSIGGSSSTRLLPNSLGAIDLSSSAVRASIPVRAAPTGVAVGYGAVWVTNSVAGTVSRIDPTSQSVTPISVGANSEPVGIAVGAGKVWVTNSASSSVSEIDPQSERVVRVFPVGSGPTGVTISHPSTPSEARLWVSNTNSATVSMIDLNHRRLSRTIQVGSEPAGIAAGTGRFADSVWVANEGSDTVQRIDATSASAVAAPIPVGAGPSGVAFGAGAVWVANSIDGSVTRIDAGGQLAPITTTVGAGAYAVAVNSAKVWVSNQFANNISVLNPDPSRQGVIRTITTESAPLGLAIGAGRLWVAADGSGAASHRGGVLRAVAGTVGFSLSGSGDSPSVDPSPAYDFTMWKLITMTNDGLVAYRREGGVGGAALVPDLATTLPIPTDHGKTYTFQLRRGIQYSNGKLVKASDFRYALERGFRFPDDPIFYFNNLVGGAACQRNPKTCDLSQGVVANDTDGTVTFHLTQPDPEFLYQLTLPVADAIPAGTPTPLRAGAAVPATGPYMVKSYQPKVSGHGHGHLVLVRNPHFHVWSAAARPDGFADRIEVTSGYTATAEVSMVEHGKADVMWDELPAAAVNRISANYPEQVHLKGRGTTSFAYLNTRVPPFDNRDARLAINYAVNRGQLVADARGDFLGGQVTCQIIPPDYPGYVRRCPFTINPVASGRWSGQDITTAKQLVARSGTTGARVTVLTSTQFPRKLGTDLVASLNGIGYRARLRVLQGNRYFGVIASNRTAQVGFDSWAADYTTPSNFINTLVACNQGQALNNGQFCNRAIDDRIKQALRDQVVDPGRATREWSDLDRDLLTQAPLVTFSNGTNADFVARRVGNYQSAPEWGELVDQLWVR